MISHSSIMIVSLTSVPLRNVVSNFVNVLFNRFIDEMLHLEDLGKRVKSADRALVFVVSLIVLCIEQVRMPSRRVRPDHVSGSLHVSLSPLIST